MAYRRVAPPKTPIEIEIGGTKLKILESLDGNFVEETFALVRETEKALLIEGGKGEVWLPKSQLEEFDIHKATNGEIVVSVVMPEWLAIEKELV
jgi:RNase P/RNase MRP subunit p29